MISADHDELFAEPSSPDRDARSADEIAQRIIARDNKWRVPLEPLDLGGTRWTPHLVADGPPRALHIHLSETLPSYVARRLVAAAASHRVYVALFLETLYDDAV